MLEQAETGGDSTGAITSEDHRGRILSYLRVVPFLLFFFVLVIRLFQPTRNQNFILLLRNQAGVADGTIPLEGQSWKPPPATARCDYVIDVFTSKNRNVPEHIVRASYAKQSVDANTFYRATASIFWEDFVLHNWDDQIYKRIAATTTTLLSSPDGIDDTPIQDKSTWTWVTGDQHLSNFGAWRNRHGNVVFSVNDFDEAAIYDFHVDVLRVAVSIYNHAVKNGLSPKHIVKSLKAFTDKYVDTVTGYVGNEEALTFELTKETAEGALKHFLKGVEHDKSHRGQLEKFTNLTTGTFVRNEDTRLVSVEPEIEAAIRRAFTSQQYGATLMKTGWRVPSEWSNDYFAIRDVTRRLGSGVGSFGVDRFYVLLNGTDDAHHIILDVKYEPAGGVSKVLNADDRAWYNVLFRNEAARAVEAQRRLTSYVDPFTGWALIRGNAFVVRQRSPWKDSPDLDQLTDYHEFKTFAEMVAIATATSHTRGTQAKAPGEFKEVIASILGGHYNQKAKKRWGKVVAEIAKSYSEQVLLDYACFKDYVDTNYPGIRDDADESDDDKTNKDG